MLGNSDFDDGIKLKKISNKNKFIKNSKIYYYKSIKRMKKILAKNKKIFLIFFFFIYLLLFFFLKSQKQMKNEKISYIYDKPMLPFNKEDIIVKPFTNIYYNSSNIRYHFHDLFENRKIFKINYNFLIYTKINKKISFDENAKNIYESTGILNLTKLLIYYNNIDINTSKFNHIHLGMAFDKNYIFLTVISMASILNTASPYTYIHFHLILVNNIQYKDLKSIIDLNKINKNVEFIFYNGKQAEYDFGKRGKKEWRRVGDYARILIPEIVNNTNKIIIMDSADIIAKKDLSELYFFDIGDNYFAFTLDAFAGNFQKNLIFSRNNFYPNAGVCLTNLRKFKEDNLYKYSFFASLAYKNLPCPSQDIFLMISNYKFKYLPLNYNCPQFFKDNEKNVKDNNSRMIYNWLLFQKYSQFRYSKEELIKASINPVLIHLNAYKPFYNLANSENTLTWINYAKMAGVYSNVKKKYPNILKRFNLE